jgi:hypothetical protein
MSHCSKVSQLPLPTTVVPTCINIIILRSETSVVFYNGQSLFSQYSLNTIVIPVCSFNWQRFGLFVDLRRVSFQA